MGKPEPSASSPAAGQPRGGLLRATAWLYLRMGILTVTQLAVTRLLLSAMGVDDYGLWTLAYSLVLLWSFPADVAGEVSLRWLSVSAGSGATLESRGALFCRLRRRARLIIGGAALASLVAGVWWVSDVASITPDTVGAARSLVAVLTIMMALKCLAVQYMSWLVAEERFSSYAWLSIAEGVGTLVCAGVLWMIPASDTVAVYAWLLVGVELAVVLGYRRACRVDEIMKNSVATSATTIDCGRSNFIAGTGQYLLWNAFGGLAVMVWLQGMAPLMNLGHGLAVTAAVGVAMLLLAKVRGFCAGFERAVVPRLMKLHAAGEARAARSLMLRYSGCTFALTGLLLGVLVWLAPVWLRWWLGELPPGCVAMTRTALTAAWLCSVDVPLDAVVMARGRIRAYELTMGICLLCAPAAVAVASLCGLPAPAAFAWQLLPLAITLPLRLAFALRATHLPSLRLR